MTTTDELVEKYRKLLMARFSERLSMEEIATLAHEIAKDVNARTDAVYGACARILEENFQAAAKQLNQTLKKASER